ncbi:hypothetical protein FRC12_018125 [Ceratobasidium sp. 428]|nr:hypothetical protein FRC12_018125 [Ceratobasidium sp. 428]
MSDPLSVPSVAMIKTVFSELQALAGQAITKGRATGHTQTAIFQRLPTILHTLSYILTESADIAVYIHVLGLADNTTPVDTVQGSRNHLEGDILVARDVLREAFMAVNGLRLVCSPVSHLPIFDRRNIFIPFSDNDLAECAALEKLLPRLKLLAVMVN